MCYKKDGTLSSHGRRWFDLLEEHGLPDTYDKDECVQEFLGEKLKQDLYDAKGKKIN